MLLTAMVLDPHIDAAGRGAPLDRRRRRFWSVGKVGEGAAAPDRGLVLLLLVEQALVLALAAGAE
jgi:hypothetical protein